MEIGVCGARSRLVDVWVMHGMVMDETLHVPLVVGSVSCSVCVNRRCLRCTIWAAALRTASSWRCAAASMELSVCLARCWCRACVTASLMVVSLTRGYLKRCSVTLCAWLWVGQPSRCRRVPPGTSPLACPCLYGGGIS